MAKKRKSKKRSSSRCKKGQIKIRRRGYTTKRGTRVRPSEFCIDDQGRPGRTTRGAESGPYSGDQPWIQEEGSLGEGFLTDMSFAEQKRHLESALASEKKQHRGDYVAAYRATLGKVMALNRSTRLRRKYGREIDRVRDWFVKEYGADSHRWPKDRAANEGLGRLKNSLTAIPFRFR